MSDRQHFVDRADECAKLTIPTLFQKDPTNNNRILDPHQSLGARGVNNLASKMVLSLLPMNTPFFKLNVDTLALKEEGQDDMKVEIERGLGVIERGVIREIEESGDITVTFEALKHLAVTGNVLMFVGEGGSRLFDLNKYVVSRDPSGNLLEIVTCEMTAPASLSDEQRKLLSDKAGEGSPEKHVPVYTHVKIADGRVKWHQEINGQKVPGTESEVPEQANPWLALRFMRVDGESYGRGYVEMYKGDLDSLEVLTRAVRDASVSAAKVVWLVNPNGSTNARTIAKAENNSVKTGNADDVTCLRMDKAYDLRVAQEMITSIERRLAFAFMINAEVMRDAERVTAEEVRLVAQELDDSLGGIYSILSKDFQLPYVNRRLHLLRRAGKVPKLPDTVSPVIVTGFAALGRGHDRDKLLRFAKMMLELYGPEQFSMYIDPDELNARLAIADGIEAQGLLVSKEDRQAKQQQGMQSQLMEQLGPEAVKQMGPMIQEQMKGMQGNGPAQSNPPQQASPAAAIAGTAGGTG